MIEKCIDQLFNYLFNLKQYLILPFLCSLTVEGLDTALCLHIIGLLRIKTLAPPSIKFECDFCESAEQTLTPNARAARYEEPKTQQLLHSVRHYRERAGSEGTYFVSHNRTFQGFSKLV